MDCHWGFCGAGLICHDFAAAISTVIDGNGLTPAQKRRHYLTAVAARDLARAEDFAKRFGFLRAFDSYEAIARDETVNVVYIGVVHSHHYPLAKTMIEAGKHVLCEKPLTLHMEQTSELFDLAKSKKVFFMEGIWSRCFPLYHHIQDQLKIGTIGEVVGVTCEFGQPINHRERVKNKAIGGGGLMDIGIYVIQFAIMAFGGKEPYAVNAVGTKMTSGADETGSLMLQFGDGKFAHLVYSCKVKMKNNAVIYGTSGQIEIPDIFWSPTSLLVNGEKIVFPVPSSKFLLNFPNSEGFVFEVEEVARCLENGLLESPCLPHEESLVIHRIIHQSLRQMGVDYE